MMQLGWCKGVKSLVYRRESDVTMDSDATLHKKNNTFCFAKFDYYAILCSECDLPITFCVFVCVL